MKTKVRTLIFFVVIIVFAISCKNNDDNNNENSDGYTKMEELVVSENFNWSTTQDVEIRINTKDNAGDPIPNVLIEVYTAHPDEGGLLMIKGMSDQNGYFHTARPVSSDYEHLVFATKHIGLLDFVKVPIENNMAEYTFGGVPVKNKSMKWIEPKSTNSIIKFLGTYNNQGVPDYLVVPDDLLDAQFTTDITNTLPEGQNVSVAHPEYLQETYQHDLELECQSTVWVTFVHEAASYKNVLGFYTYELGNPPTSTADIDSITVIFPNTSYAGSGGGLNTGNKVNIGTFPDNTGIGWVLIADGFENGQVTDGRNYYYSERDFNPESDPDLRQHSVFLLDPARDLVILGFEDIQRDNQGNDISNCDHDFNDCMYYVTTDPLPCAILDMPVIDYTQTDSDSDGVPDVFDDYPANSEFAFNNYYPCGIAHGTLAFEDLWPGKGDYDFNDLVTNYSFNQITNGNNKIAKVTAEFIVRAHGASFHNGFGFQFDIAPNQVSSITGQDIQEGYITLNTNNTEADQTKATIIVFDDTYNILPHPGGGGIGVNTQETATYVDPVTINIDIELNGTFTSAELGIPPFNPFIICDGQRGYEVHLPDNAPTDLHNEALFGTLHDNSIPATGRYYKTDRNLPWAIDIWAEFEYPIEKVEVTAAHLKFADWAESDGTLYTDWYEDNTGYRNDNNIFHPPQ